MFGIKGSLVSVKKKVTRILGVFNGSTREDSRFSALTPVLADSPHEPASLVTNYFLEAELKKAEALEYWRRFLNRPK